MALFVGEGESGPLIGEALARALARRLHEIVGVGLLALGAVLALACLSYNPADPSHFSASGAAPANWLGAPGAVLADPVMRILGLGGLAAALLPAVWGLRFLLHRGEERIWARCLLGPPALLLVCLFASTHTLPAWWPLEMGLGGHLGDSGLAALLPYLPYDIDPAFRILSVTLGIGAAAALAAAAGVTLGEARGALAWMAGSFADLAASRPRMGAGALASAGSGLAWVRERAAGASWGAPQVSRDFDGRAAPILARPAVARPAAAPPDTISDSGGLASAGTALGAAIRALKGAGGTDADAETMGRAREGALRAALPPAGAVTVGGTGEPDDEDETLRTDPRDTGHTDAPAVYDRPSLDYLQRPCDRIVHRPSDEVLQENARQLEVVLSDYGVRGQIVAVKPGPVVTLYELEPAPGLKAARVIGLADDIARSMSALAARVSTVPGRSVIGIELPNDTRETVYLREVFEEETFEESRHALALALGKDIEGQTVVANLAKMPHLLIAGTTGSGKSVAINTMILSLLYRMGPERCRLIMIDPKMLELSVYDGIPHLLAPVVTDPKKALVALKWVVAEMEDRYRKMSKTGVRNIDGYNARVKEALAKGEQFERTVQTGFDETTGEAIYETEVIAPEAMPLIVVIVDEMADLMMVAGKEIEACIQRLAQMARASGIHLIMATQRPSVDVITGTIKANFPTRISFQVTSKIDSRTILGEQGAEQLLGQGDMLYMAGGGRIRRVHGPFVSDDEVEEVVRHLKSLGPPEYVNQVTEGGDEETVALVDEKLGLAGGADSDETLYDKAVAIVARDRKCSTSYIQRKLAIGYNKAARLVEEMETQGVVTPANAVGKREILIEER